MSTVPEGPELPSLPIWVENLSISIFTTHVPKELMGLQMCLSCSGVQLQRWRARGNDSEGTRQS